MAQMKKMGYMGSITWSAMLRSKDARISAYAAKILAVLMDATKQKKSKIISTKCPA